MEEFKDVRPSLVSSYEVFSSNCDFLLISFSFAISIGIADEKATGLATIFCMSIQRCAMPRDDDVFLSFCQPGPFRGLSVQ